jgi:hypothetical protein
MIRILVAALLLISCRTRPLEPPDLSPPPDLAASDLASSVDLITSASMRDLATRDGAVPCGGLNCDEATEICVFLNRGDCAKYQCVPVPAACKANRTCGCVGAGFCPGLEMPGETLKCDPTQTFPPGPDVIVCQSSIQCV